MTNPIYPISLWILPLASEQASLALVGGKGMNLARLARAGFPVPPGFLLTTRAYHDFMADNQLIQPILTMVERVDPADLQALEEVSRHIRALFAAGVLRPELKEQILAAYERLDGAEVAVRSSATAEDLPDMSFAGQQDTYLNIVGSEQVCQAVVNCWSSLWTARAIGYRARNQVAHSEAALAVVVQTMVESQASGVMFTANPLSGLRSEIVIDATLGLGEALVSGQVEPDHYVVDLGKGAVIHKSLGAKALAIHGKAGGGTQTEEQPRSDVQALADEQITALAQLGAQVQAEYGFPQDIEWAWAGGRLYLLQSRPVTSLFPLPAGLPAKPLKAFFSFAAVQGMLDPMTPLGIDAVRVLFARGAGMFGVHVTGATQTALYTAAARLWVNFTPVLTNSVGRKAVPTVLSMVEPGTGQAVQQIWQDPGLQPRRAGVSLQGRLRLARFLLPLVGNVLLNMAAPTARRSYIISYSENILRALEKKAAAIQGDHWQKLAARADLMPEVVSDRFLSMFRLFISAVASGMASWNFMNMLANNAASPTDKKRLRDLVLQATRGMPYNPTTQMDLELWEIARELKSDPAVLQYFQSQSSSDLAAQYLSGRMVEKIMRPIRRFLEKYGGRGLAEIDLGRGRWADDPSYVFSMLSNYLAIEDQAQAPDAVFGRGAQAASQAVEELARMVRQSHGGWLKSRLLRFFASRARQLMGMRENPKFFAVRLMYFIRRALLESGQDLAQAGDLTQSDDVFFLTFDELKQFAARQPQDWRGLVASRRAEYQREQRRRNIPRLLLSDGRAFYEGLGQLEDTNGALVGSPVSPGQAKGRVRVVLDPHHAGLQPGEILVCPGTDPSWTPLFLTASGLIMEVGGMMTHGAVVAREYGIPAIVGLDQATQRLKTGQLIRMDGSTGQIVLLEQS